MGEDHRSQYLTNDTVRAAMSRCKKYRHHARSVTSSPHIKRVSARCNCRALTTGDTSTEMTTCGSVLLQHVANRRMNHCSLDFTPCLRYITRRAKIGSDRSLIYAFFT
ncbi:hypothetical protein KCU95_g97, partial [Aureobasidium melanogenum]